MVVIVGRRLGCTTVQGDQGVGVNILGKDMCSQRVHANGHVLTREVWSAKGRDYPRGRSSSDGTMAHVGGPKGDRGHEEQIMVRWVSGANCQGSRSGLCREGHI